MDANDITLLAADRLEAALERLAVALEARERIMLEAREAAMLEAREQAMLEVREPAMLEIRQQALLEARAELAREASPAGDMVPRAEVERLSARLDEALSRLRTLLGDDAGAEI